MSKLFTERIAYKPFEYPEYYTEGWLPQNMAHWLHTEISMQSDIKDWNENLSESEKHLIGNILLGFAQTECAVSDYWTNHVTKWFPKHEIKQMAMSFGAQETIHAAAYSYLNDCLGLDNFSGFLAEPKIKDRFDMLASASNDWTYHDLSEKHDARIDVAKSLAVFSAFAEGVSLFSSFAVLYSFQMRTPNMLKGIGQQMKWSIRDESLHSRMGCRLFNQMCQEFPELRSEAKETIINAAKLMQQIEFGFIDKMFEMGDLENLRSQDLKEFINRRLNEKLYELGYNPIFNVDSEKADKLDWFYHLSGGVENTDFFAVRPTAYSKADENDDWHNIW